MTKLPDFLIIGAAKAGTTALMRALSKHSSIFCPAEKEPRFFAFVDTAPQFPCPGGEFNARTIITSEEKYFDLFSACPPGAVAGEASTAYMYLPAAPEAASRYVPRARLVAVLRHPVERAYSQWLHLRQEGLEPFADFEEAWTAEDERIAKGWRHVWHYRHRGYYGRQIERWLEFFPREQLLILLYEDWLQRPQTTLQEVCKHLGVDSTPLSVTRANVTSRQPRWSWLHHRMVGDNRIRRWAQRALPLPVREAITSLVRAVNLKPGPKLDGEVRAQLSTVYHDDLKSVERLTGRDLSSWRE